ncbi:serine protease, partial [Streptomyces sp. NPDC097619]|uniref:serine protease n=1 Tax=Streptomyces sp. NPDC097619 TaxID=3157228 RepID=UPI00332BDD24
MTEVRRPPVGSGQGFQHAVAEVRTAHGARGTVAGAGFLVGPGLLVTCAHVVANAGYGPGQRVPLSFPSWSGAGAGEVHGTVETDTWREADAEDTAFLRLDAVPAGAVPLPLGIAEDCAQHPGVTYGFPRNARQGGHFGTVRIGRLLEGAGDEAGTVPLLQLSEANAVTEGFSGGPVLDEVTGLVIGMTTAITGADRHGRGAEVAYATPARTLRALHPELAEHAVCPYPGLKPFTTEDAAVFRGRATALEAVLAALRGPLRVILLLGPSGSGKSSLLRAGVLPTLAEGLRVPGGDRWLPVVVPGPGRDLLLAAEEHGLPGAATDGIGPAAERLLAERPDRTRVLLVVDQFEELLAPTATPEDRSGIGAAAEELAALARSWAPVTVVLAMRDDFYAPLAARAPALLEATAPHVNVPATLDASDLRAMIEHGEHGPLVESGLTARLIGDLIPPADGPQPRTTRSTPVTCLPALQLTLRQLWEGRSHGTLTHETYDRLGTVTGALSAWCTTEFRLLPHPDTARTILTALVEPADPDHAIPAARRRVPVPTLRALTGGPEAGSRPAIGSGFGIRPASGSHIGTGSDSGTGQAEFDATLAALVDRRFVTLRTPRSEPSAGGQPGAVRPAEPVAELVHDSLVRDWPQLHQWVTTDQEFQRWLRRAEDRHARWLRAPEGGPWLGLRLRLPQRLRPGGAGPAPARAP